MLHRARVLVVEDDILAALELAAAVERAGGVALGPVATVAEALCVAASEEFAAAILDVQLEDRDVAPLASALLRRGVPVLFHTASDLPAEIVEQFGDLPVCPKPMSPDTVVLRLGSLLSAPKS